ncbi:MAG: triose-phosphate isomerase [Azovibrio sp.]|uniref:triose-phosphate isomerase n=1 Tax=Azovibrio sp. TaxID=1872673 RepID=UPI003C771EB3
MRRQPLVAGNWKMNGSLSANQALVAALLASRQGMEQVEIAVCVPYPYLDQVSRLVQGSWLALGAQDVSAHAAGAYTGEVAAGMLQDFACRYVIVGHSERRTLHAETDVLVSAKFAAVQGAGMVPVLCLGETLAEHQAGATLAVLFRQLDAVLAEHGVGAMTSCVLAYEPVWAIGTGLSASPGQAQEVHQALRRHVAALDEQVAAGLQIVYGGSVKADNAAQLFAQPDIDGGLIGGASLNAKDFLAICQAANY